MNYNWISNPFSNLGNNQKFVMLNQNKEPNYNIQYNRDYYTEKEKLNCVSKDKNKLHNKSIKTMRLHNNFIGDNIKRKESEQKYLGFKAMKKINNNNIISKKNNEINRKLQYDNLYNNNIINLNNGKKKYESTSKNNFLMNNHINETIKYNKRNINNIKNEEENYKKDSKSKKIIEKLKTINKINYEDQQLKIKNNKNQVLDKNEENNQKEETGNIFNQYGNKKEGIRKYYKRLKKNSKILEDEKNLKIYNDINKNENQKDLEIKNNNLLKPRITKQKKTVNNRTIEKKLNDCKIIDSKNIHFKINKIPKDKFFYIVKNNNIKFQGNNKFLNPTKQNEINFTIKNNDNQKTLKNNLNNSKIIRQIELNTNEAKNNKNINKYTYDKKNETNYKKESIQKNDQDNFYKNRNHLQKSKKIYGFINNGNNCYLNSSLQLLTRVNDLKEKILNFNDINKDINTNGQLTKEFKSILYKIENDEERRCFSPDKLKRVMANIDERYTKNHQEDANEFISFFLNALISETANKNKVIDKIEVYDKNDEDAFNKFYKKFYIKKGYSFILELFYGIIKTEKICKSCKERNFIKFSSFNVLDLPIYSLAKSNKILDLKVILNKYLSEYKNNGFTCIKCNANNVYTNTIIYSLPKYLILFLARIVENEYLYNEIKYPEQFNFNEYTNNLIKIKANYNYKLECVIEHSGGAYSGHYTALCRILDNCWYDFSDSHGYMHSQGFESKNAIILLYKAQ